jgi:hypothetical protein
MRGRLPVRNTSVHLSPNDASPLIWLNGAFSLLSKLCTNLYQRPFGLAFRHAAKSSLRIIQSLIRDIRPIDDRDSSRFSRRVKDVVRHLAHARRHILERKLKLSS